MVIYDFGPVTTTSSSSGNMMTFHLNAVRLYYENSGSENTRGSNTLIFTDKKTGVRYVASVNIRAEFSDEYSNSFFLGDKVKELEHNLNKKIGDDMNDR